MLELSQSIHSIKMKEYKSYQHNPPHLFIDNAKYFITVSTLGKHPYLKSENAKWSALNYLIKLLNVYHWELEDWVILDNHVHMMINAPEDSTSLSNVMNNFHRFTANWLSKHKIKRIGEKYFHNCWDTCITYEKLYFARLNLYMDESCKTWFCGIAGEMELWKLLLSFSKRSRRNRKACEKISI